MSGTVAVMEFREYAGRKVLEPSYDVDDLSVGSAAFKGEFNVRGEHIEGGGQTGAVGEGVIVESLVSAVDLAGATLAPLEITNASLVGVTLTNARLTNASVRRSEFLRCRATGLLLTLTDSADAYAEGCTFDYASLDFLNSPKKPVIFRECTFVESV